MTIEGNSTADVLTAKGGTSGGYFENGTAGAGIGSPIGGTKGGNIIIRNVTIHATGGEIINSAGGAGIGSSSNGTCGDIMIANAVIFADGGDYAAAIGMGCNSIFQLLLSGLLQSLTPISRQVADMLLRQSVFPLVIRKKEQPLIAPEK